MAKNIKFNIELAIDGKRSVVSASMNARELAGNLSKAQTNGERLRKSLLTWNQAQQSFQNLTNGIQQLAAQMHEYTAANAAQVEAETKLSTNMRNTMAATDAEIQSIKNLTAAQQKLGIVGDEVQIAGAQELSLHLKKAETLRQLIPVMNDLIVKQGGLNASSSTATSVASLLGKAMDGNTSALKRAGIVLTDHQKKIIETGNEEERAAALVDVLKDKVGGLNAEMAKTDAGKVVQAKNAFGDLKEQIGALIAPYESLVVSVGQFGLAINAVVSMSTGIISATRALSSWVMTARMTDINTRLASKAVAAFTRMMGLSSVSITAGTAAVKALTWALRGLEAALGIGGIVLALCSAFSSLGLSERNAAASTDDLTHSLSEADDAARNTAQTYEQTLKSTYSDLMSKYEGLRAGWKALSTEQQKVEWIRQNQNEFKELRLQINNVHDAEDILVKNTGAVVEAFKRRAEAAAYAAKLAALYEQKLALEDKRRTTVSRIGEDARKTGRNAKEGDIIPMGSGYTNERYGKLGTDPRTGKQAWVFTKQGAGLYNGTDTSRNPVIQGIDNQLTDLNADIDDTAKNLTRLKKEDMVITPSKPTGGGGRVNTRPGKTTNKEEEPYLAGQLGWYDKQISELNKKQLHLSDPEDIRLLNEQIAKLERAKTLLEIMSQFTKEERTKYGALNATDTSAASQVGGASLAPAGMTGDDWTKRIAQDWEENKKAMKDYFDEFQRRWDLKPFEDAKKAAAEHNKKLSDMGQLAQQAGQAFAGMGRAFESPVLQAAGIIAQAIATMLLGYAQATAGGAKLDPWGWAGMALSGLATVTAVIEQMKNIGQYAKGGIAYGPTLGLFGEYTGARTNPEVVAPLDRLRSLMGDGIGGGKVEFEIKGRTLRGVLRKDSNYIGRG